MRSRRLLVADPTRKHWKETTAARVLAAWRESALSLGDFARANGVYAQRLQWWRKRMEAGARETAASVAPLTFIPAAVMGSARVALRLPGGVELEGSVAAIPVEWVAALARELGRS